MILGGLAMVEDNTFVDSESLTFSQAKLYPQLMIHEDLDEAKVKQLQDTYSYDKETARIMLDSYRETHYMTRHLSLVEDLINLNKEVAIKLLIKYKITFIDKEGNKIGYKD